MNKGFHTVPPGGLFFSGNVVHSSPRIMNGRQKELLARHCLLHLDEIPKLWHGKEWDKLAVVVEYAEAGVPVAMSKTDPYMYRKLCAGLCEFHIRGFDGFSLPSLRSLAELHRRSTRLEDAA